MAFSAKGSPKDALRASFDANGSDSTASVPLFGGTEAPSLDSCLRKLAGRPIRQDIALASRVIAGWDLSALRREPAVSCLNMGGGGARPSPWTGLGTDISYLWSAGEASRASVRAWQLSLDLDSAAGWAGAAAKGSAFAATVLTSNGRFDSGGCTEMLGWSAGALLASGEGVPRLVGAVSRNSSRSGASRLSPSDAVLPSGLALGAKMSALSSPAPADAIRALMSEKSTCAPASSAPSAGRRRKDRPKGPSSPRSKDFVSRDPF